MESKFYKYAYLLLTKGLCINKGQPLLINAPIESIEFIRVLTKVACELNIRDIYYDWQDEELKYIELKNFNEEEIKASRFWNKEIHDEYAKKASKDEIIRRYLNSLLDLRNGKVKRETCDKIALLMHQLNINVSDPEVILGEIDAMKVRSCYPLSKKACETLCVSFAEQYGVAVKIGRLSYIFGPGMRCDDSKIVSVFPQCVAQNKNIVMKSKGEQLRSYTYVTDAITGLLTVLLDGENGNAYNIASKLCITTIAGIAHTLVESYPEKGLKVIFDLPTEAEAKGFSLIENAVLSSEKLEALGWEPKTDLVTGLKNVVEEQHELKL